MTEASKRTKKSNGESGGWGRLEAAKHRLVGFLLSRHRLEGKHSLSDAFSRIYDGMRTILSLCPRGRPEESEAPERLAEGSEESSCE